MAQVGEICIHWSYRCALCAIANRVELLQPETKKTFSAAQKISIIHKMKEVVSIVIDPKIIDAINKNRGLIFC